MSDKYSDESEDDEQYFVKKRTPNLPKFIKNSMENISQDKIIINVSKTQYDVIQTAAEQLGWVVSTSKKSQNWDIMWVDRYIEPQQLFRLNDHQKISHFPGIDIFAKKNLLGRNLMKMSKYFPQEYNYFPWTWSLPSQYGQLKRFQQKSASQNKKQIYIFKPSSSCQGKGIKLTQNIEELQGKSGIAQIYINNPLLIEDLKFDLRLYVLVYGHNPTRIYLYQQGLARFATENYTPAQKSNMKDTFIHLTNYAINKNNKKFIFNNDQNNMDKGHKRSVTSVYKYLQKKGVDTESLKQRIEKMIVKTLLIGQPMLSHLYHLSQPDNLSNDLAFHILGFDVLINQIYEPILLEINHTPSFTADTPLDKKIKKNLIKDTFKILNINPETKKKKISQKIQYLSKRSQKVSTKLTNQQKNVIKQKINNQKNEYENKNPCGYKRIYPLKNPIYQKIQAQTTKIFQEENRMKSNKISPSKKGRSIQFQRNSPLRSQRSSASVKEQKKARIEQNLTYNPTFSLLRKIKNTENLILKSGRNQKLPSLLNNQGRQLNIISLSAHFPKTMVQKIAFSEQDIFKEIQKKRNFSTQRNEIKKKSYFAQQSNQIEIKKPSKIDLIYSQTINASNNKQSFYRQKNTFQILQQNSIEMLRFKKEDKQRLRNILFIKKKASALGGNPNSPMKM